jgi:16S rRNA (guanine966-N2)-methyltransferase
VRVIAGQFRGTRLHAPSGIDIRPTADRLRESIFNIVGPRIRGKRVLDLFAGTGAMGIEALSRGAIHAVFIDNHPQALDLIRRNIAKVRMAERATVITWDIARNLQCLHDRPVSDIIFVDPPYGRGLIQKTLNNLQTVETGVSMIVVEHDEKESLNDIPESFLLEDQRRYGKTLVSFFNGMI